jgi:hypothetical protein
MPLIALMDVGVRYVQLDGSAYLPLMRKAGREALVGQGRDPDREVAERLARDRAVLDSVARPPDAKLGVCFHKVDDPRGAWFQDDLDPAAVEMVLHGLPVERFLFDCGAAAGDDFAFLRRLPPAAEAVLCMIDADRPLPDADAIVRRVDTAARVIDTDRFALAPRRGLSALPGETPQAAWDRQRGVLEFLMDAASRAWAMDF